MRRKISILIAGLITVLYGCMSMYDVPEQGKPAVETYRIIPEGGIENTPTLAILYPQYRSHKYGLVDEDFKDYVLKRVENTGYIGIKWQPVGRIDMKYIGFAYVYYPKDKK